MLKLERKNIQFALTLNTIQVGSFAVVNFIKHWTKTEFK